MKITTTFFTGIDQIDLPVVQGRGERFKDVYYITTDPARIREIAEPHRATLGNLESAYFTNGAKACVYRISESEIAWDDPAESLRSVLVDDMSSIGALQFSLWLLRDNALHFDRAWIVADVRGHQIVNNNIWEGRHSLADGTFNSITFDEEEFRAARLSTAARTLHIQSSSNPTMLVGGSLRFQRFQYFVGSARSSADVAIKIAQYCSGLEALVSTAQSELSHQVSERVSAVLSMSGSDPLVTYKSVKEAYGYRSKVVHGASFRAADLPKLLRCASTIDQICREMALAYLDSETGLNAAIEGSDQAATDYFLRRLMSFPT